MKRFGASGAGTWHGVAAMAIAIAAALSMAACQPDRPATGDNGR